MLQIRRLAARSVKKYAVYSIALLMCIITFSNIYCISCLADEADAVSSATETSTQSYESSTESITERSSECSSESTTEVSTDEASDSDSVLIEDIKFLLMFIISILLVMLFILVVSQF